MRAIYLICLAVGIVCCLLSDEANAIPVAVSSSTPRMDMRKMEKAAFMETFMKYVCMMNPRQCAQRNVEVPTGHLYQMNVILGSDANGNIVQR
uniref:Uncharacterized protein n=1 Tax=Plectus sambesii TaxID=2011161 RepID=A0A914V362_9BILA